MKKLVLAVAALGLISLTSCKKDYTCTCKYPGSADVATALGKQKKSDAKKTCDAANSIATIAGGSCSL